VGHAILDHLADLPGELNYTDFRDNLQNLRLRNLVES